MIALWLAACASVEPTPVDDSLPPAWMWFTSEDPPFVAAFPGVPQLQNRSENLDVGAGVTAYPARRAQVMGGTKSSFTVSVVQLPDDVLSTGGGAGAVIEAAVSSRASALGAEVERPVPWTGQAFDAHRRVTLKTGRPGESLLGVGLDGHDLWVVQAIGDRDGPAPRFLDSFERGERKEAPTALGDATIRCPGRCGDTSDQIKLAGGLEPLLGVRGVIGTDRFEAMALRLPAGVAAQPALEALEKRAMRRSKGQIVTESDADGRTLDVKAARTVYRMRFAVVGDHVYAVEVESPSGVLPDWTDTFLRPTP